MMPMSRCEQYEVWSQKEGKWEMAITFFQMDMATSIIPLYPSPMRLVRAVYEGGKLMQQDVVAEKNFTRPPS